MKKANGLSLSALALPSIRWKVLSGLIAECIYANGKLKLIVLFSFFLARALSLISTEYSRFC